MIIIVVWHMDSIAHVWQTILPGFQTHIHRPQLASCWNGRKKPCDLARATATKIWSKFRFKSPNVQFHWCFQNSSSFRWPEPPTILSPAKGKIEWSLSSTIGSRGTSSLSKRMVALPSKLRIEQNIAPREVAGDIVSLDRKQTESRNSLLWAWYELIK